MDLLLRWLPVVILVIQMLMVWVLWSLKQQFMSRTECTLQRQGCGSSKELAVEKVGVQITKAGVRINALETDVHALPSRMEFIDLTNKIERLTEKLGTVDGRLGGINRAVDLLNQHHLKVD